MGARRLRRRLVMHPAYRIYAREPVRDENFRRTVPVMVPPGERTAGAIGSAPIRVLVADGHVLFRQALRSILERQSDIVVVGEASDIGQVVSEAERTTPDVVLLDESLSFGSVGHTASLLRTTLPECQVVVLASDEDDEGLLAAVEAGVTGYITKDVGVGELLDGTRGVHQGQALIPPRMLRTLLGAMLERRHREREAFLRLSRLTTREREVLGLLASGAGNGAIAKTLMISPDTARTHVQNLLHKLGLHSRLDAASFARQTQLLSSPPARFQAIDGEPAASTSGRAAQQEARRSDEEGGDLTPSSNGSPRSLRST